MNYYRKHFRYILFIMMFMRKAVPVVLCIFVIISGIYVFDGGNGIKYLGKGTGNDEILAEYKSVPWILYSEKMDTLEENIIYDLLDAEKLCFAWAEDKIPEDFRIDGSSFLIFTEEKLRDDVVEFAEKYSSSGSANAEKIAECYDAVNEKAFMDVYLLIVGWNLKVFWNNRLLF